MHAGLFHLCQRHDRSLQLAFQRAAIVHVFGKFGGTQIGLVEQFKPDTARLGQPGRSHAETQFGQPA